jgi:hypothetical protein
MIGKKINELATELAPLSTDLTIIGDPTTGVSKKITLEQISSLFGGSVSFYTNLAGFPAVGNIDIIYCAKDTNKLYLWSGSAYVEMFPSQALLDTYQLRSEKGNANGYASLDSLGKVPISQLPSSLMEYKGMWNAATNTPTLANGTGDTGDVYICNVAGTVNFGAGPITFAVGDYVIYSGTIWQRSSGAVGTVTSVAATITGDSLTISGSPVTTSGTLAFAFNGTTAQYIRGNGTLATFPSLTGFVPYTGATANVDLGTHTLLAKDLVINHSSGSGVAASITKGGNGEALTVVKSSGSGNAASITGGVTLLSELHLTTDLADAYIASATNWNAAYNDKINSAAVTGTTTKTLTLTQQDGGTITASWTDDNTDAVTSVFGRTGAVVAVSGDYTTSLVTEGTNLYFTNARARAAISAGTGISYNSSTGVITNTITQYTDALARAAISLTTTGTSGAATYNNTTGVLNIPQYADQFVGTVTSVGLSAPTGFSVSGSPVTSSGTLALSFASGYSLPTTAKQTTWDTAYDRSLTAASVSGTTTKTLTLTKQDGSTLTASWTDINTDAVTSVFGRTGAVVATSGDYNTSQVTESGNLYFTNARAIASTLTGYTSGAGTITSSDSILSAIQKLNGNIGALTTGVSSVNGLTGAVTLTTSNIAEGTNLYYTEARVSANTNVAANTAARHNAVTLGTANGLSLSTQVLSLGLASTSTTGALSSTDWNTFNNKTSNTGTVTSVGLSSATSGVTIGSTPITTSGTITLAIATASGSQQGLLSSTDWTTFNNKQNALTNPVTGTGTINYIPKFTTTGSTIGNSAIFDDSGKIGIGTATPDASFKLTISGNSAAVSPGIYFLDEASSPTNYALYTNGSKNFVLRNQSTSNNIAVFTPSGNLGLGVTPSAWSGGFAVAEYKGGFIGSQSSSYLYQGQNGYFNGTNWVYTTNGSATKIEQSFGAYRWYQAPSGTAGNAISFTQAMTLNASGNLSIGNTNDTYKLDVTGTGRFSGDVTVGLGNALESLLIINGQTYSGLRFQRAGTTKWAIFNNNAGTDFLDIYNYTTNSSSLAISTTGAATFTSSITAGGNLQVAGANTGTPLGVRTNTNQNWRILDNSGPQFDCVNDALDARVDFRIGAQLYIAASGNVGIGTTAPGAKLDIVSTGAGSEGLRVDGATGGFAFVVRGGSTYTTHIRAGATIGVNYFTTPPTNGLIVEGNVGIGTTSPQVELHVKGTNGWGELRLEGQSFSGGNGGAVEFYSEGTALADIYSDTTKNLIFRTNGSTERMRITSGGSVLIGTTTEGFLGKLQVAGSVAITGQYNTVLPSSSFSYFDGSGQVVSSSSNASALYLDTTWNTTGNPDGIYLNVTNTASGASSKLLNLKVGSVSQFSVSKAGAIQTTAPSSGSAQPWKLGSYAAGGTGTATGVIYIEVNGQIYSIPALLGTP